MIFVVLLSLLHTSRAALETPTVLVTFEENPAVVNLEGDASISESTLLLPTSSSYSMLYDFSKVSTTTTFGDSINDKAFVVRFTSGDATSLASSSTAFIVYRYSDMSSASILQWGYDSGVIAFKNEDDTRYWTHSTGVTAQVHTDYCLVLSCDRDASECTSFVSTNATNTQSKSVTVPFGPFLSSEDVGHIVFNYPAAAYTEMAVYPQQVKTTYDIALACHYPVDSPTSSPTQSPSQSPTESPTESPTLSPTVSPTESPSASPTEAPSASPSDSPTVSPSATPTSSPTQSPSVSPTSSPTAAPTAKDETPAPSNRPTESPTKSPSVSPTTSPSMAPSTSPTHAPSTLPSTSPSVTPTATPTIATDCDVSIVTQGGDGLSWDLTDDEGDEEIASGDLADSSASFTLGIGEDYLLFLSSSTLPSSATMNITVNGDSRVLELPAGTLLSTEIAGLTCEGLVDKISTIDSAYTLVVGLLSLGIALLL